MKTLAIDRRRLLKLGISSSVALAIPSCITRENAQMQEWLEHVSDAELPVDEAHTGTLDDAAFEALAGLCRYVDRVWELGSDMPSYLQRLRADLEFKTKERPSYLTEYEHAIELAENTDESWAALLFASFPEAESERFAHTKLGRARRFVFAEIVTHQIPISGAFKSFGLWNYAGYFGGAFTDKASYRRAEPK